MRKPKTKKPVAPSVEREPDAEALAKPLAPELPHPKPAPKPKGWKKAMR